MEIVLAIIILIIVVYAGMAGFQTFSDYKKTEEEKRQKEQREKEKREKMYQLEKDSDTYFERYKNSEFVTIIVDKLKNEMPTPYGWGVRVNNDNINGYRFYELGYEDLYLDEQIYGLAKAIAYNLGSDFKAYYDGTDYNHLYFGVKYAIPKPLKQI